MRLLNSQQASFEQELTELLAFETVNDQRYWLRLMILSRKCVRVGMRWC